jgi:hypothetical protein
VTPAPPPRFTPQEKIVELAAISAEIASMEAQEAQRAVENADRLAAITARIEALND